MTKKIKRLHGKGRNDAGYPVTKNKLIDGIKQQVWRCPFYTVWKSMIERCYSVKFQRRNPAYIGCTVAPEWLHFSNFKAWMELQQWEGNQLDKDIIFPGNKVYSSSSCVFISARLNSFMTGPKADLEESKTAERWLAYPGKYHPRCRNPFTGKSDSLGYFDSPEEAQEAWRARKHQHACAYAELQKDERVASALRNRYVEQVAA